MTSIFMFTYKLPFHIPSIKLFYFCFQIIRIFPNEVLEGVGFGEDTFVAGNLFD